MHFSNSLQSALFFICICLFASITYAAPASNQEEHLEKRASYAITGLKSSGTHQRLEIRQLQKNPAQWHLYLLALNRFKGMSQTDKLSYYQVSGIHGRPFVAWDNVQFTPGQSGSYCTHDIILFPTWHRPYLALYEQILYGIVQQVANEMTGSTKSAYVSAAKTFRSPYWDWAAPKQAGKVYPDIFKGNYQNGVSYLDIKFLNGTTRKIRNPLYSYNFHPLNANELPNSPFNTWSTTLRYPTSKDRGATSRNDAVAAQMLQSQPSFSQRFMNLLQVYSKFEHFGNEGWVPNNSGSYDSLESLHDQIHGLVGNGGHMAIIDYAAFDPIFWLHHTNVDRLYAIWQAIYPNSWMPATNKINYGTAILTAGQNVNQDTPLKPFHKDTAGNFWTSKTARYTTTFGYTYPETANASPASAKKAVNALYGPTSGKKLSKRHNHNHNHNHKHTAASGTAVASGTAIASGTAVSAAVASASRTALAAAIAAGLAPEAASSIAANATGGLTPTTASPAAASGSSTPQVYKEWITNIRVAKDALQQAFFIHIFLGDFNPDPSCWSFEPNLVGTHAVFTPFTNASAALNSDHQAIVTGTIPLTRTLNAHAEQGLVDMDDEAAVEKYLRRNLHWRVTEMDDSFVPRGEVPELKISVVSCDVTAAEAEDEFPVWGEFSVHRGITRGRDAGLGDDEDS